MSTGDNLVRRYTAVGPWASPHAPVRQSPAVNVIRAGGAATSTVVAKNATITGKQIRAARGFLAWERRDLAKKSVVTLYTIERIETGAEMSGAAITKGLAAIKAALGQKASNSRAMPECLVCCFIRINGHHSALVLKEHFESAQKSQSPKTAVPMLSSRKSTMSERPQTYRRPSACMLSTLPRREREC